MLPDFYIVGAPKCGTSSLYDWLRQHPQIGMPYHSEKYWRYKEPYYFAPDLVEPPHRVEREEYLEIMRSVDGCLRLGEASALYLYSTRAADLIAAERPDAKIIILLRRPADFVVSWWRDCLFHGHDACVDFRRAVDPSRPSDDHPAGCWYPKMLRYLAVAQFSVQISRYLDAFPRNQVLVLDLHDLQTQPQNTLARVLAFLDVDAPHKEIATTAQNVAQPVRKSVRIERGLQRRLDALPAGRRAVAALDWVFARVSPEVGATVTEDDRAYVRAALAVEAERVSDLTGCDTSHW